MPTPPTQKRGKYLLITIPSTNMDERTMYANAQWLYDYKIRCLSVDNVSRAHVCARKNPINSTEHNANAIELR
jgi:hypothetical protein